METNNRFREEAGGLTSEVLSDLIRVFWDPITDDAHINFETTRFLSSGDEYIARLESDSTVSVSKDELLVKEYEIDGVTYTGEGVIQFIKILFDEEYNAQYGEQPEEPMELEE